MSKPREWTIRKDRIEIDPGYFEVIQIAQGVYVEDERVPVIEKSAYDALSNQVTQLKGDFQAMESDRNAAEDKYNDLCGERNALAAELADAISVNENAAKKIHALAAEKNKLEHQFRCSPDRRIFDDAVKFREIAQDKISSLEHEIVGFQKAIREVWKERDELRTANVELLEALKDIAQETGTPYARIANEALAKHGGGG